MGKAKPVKTTGKGFRLYCQDYRKKRKSKGLKQLTRSELLKKATELWLKLDKREKNRYSSVSDHKFSSLLAVTHSDPVTGVSSLLQQN